MKQDWTIKDLIAWTTRYFQKQGLAAARLEAEILLAYALEENRVFLYTNFDAPVNQQERERFRRLIQRRTRREPLAYITGEKEFMSLRFAVSPEVLIPRPETELLVETAIDLCARDGSRICDVGTGSGAIAVSLAHYLPSARITAVDVSMEALQIAGRNAARHGVDIDFQLSDLLAEIDPAVKFDLIVANLPYITEAQYQCLEPEIRLYEPQQALLGGGDGLDIYRRLMPQASKHLNEGGRMLLEIGADQGHAAMDLARSLGPGQVMADLAGKDRLIIIEKGSDHDYQVLAD
ncbi:MAG: peptide chain release factor N(5)-glutamine methyltransferase [Syntrophomonadaceae bacterium]